MSGSMFALRPEAREFKPSGVSLAGPLNAAETQSNLANNILGYQCLNDKNVAVMSSLNVSSGHAAMVADEKTKPLTSHGTEHLSSPMSVSSTTVPTTYVPDELCTSFNGSFKNKTQPLSVGSMRQGIEAKNCWASLNPNAPPFVPTVDAPFLYEEAGFCHPNGLLQPHGIASLIDGVPASAASMAPLLHPSSTTSDTVTRNSPQPVALHPSSVAFVNPLPRQDEAVIASGDKPFHPDSMSCPSSFISSPLQYHHYIGVQPAVHPAIENTTGFPHPHQFCSIRATNNAPVLDQGYTTVTPRHPNTLNQPLPVTAKTSEASINSCSTGSAVANIKGSPQLKKDTGAVISEKSEELESSKRGSSTGTRSVCTTRYADVLQTEAAPLTTSAGEYETLDQSVGGENRSNRFYQNGFAHPPAGKGKYSSWKTTASRNAPDHTADGSDVGKHGTSSLHGQHYEESQTKQEKVKSVDVHSKAPKATEVGKKVHTDERLPETARDGVGNNSNFSKQAYKLGKRSQTPATTNNVRRYGPNHNSTHGFSSHPRYDQRRYSGQSQKNNPRSDKNFTREKGEYNTHSKSKTVQLPRHESKETVEEKVFTPVKPSSPRMEKETEMPTANMFKSTTAAATRDPPHSARPSWADMARQAAQRVVATPTFASKVPAEIVKSGARPSSPVKQGGHKEEMEEKKGSLQKSNVVSTPSSSSSLSNKGNPHTHSNKKKSNRESRSGLNVTYEPLQQPEQLEQSQHSLATKNRQGNLNNRAEQKNRGSYTNSNRRYPDTSSRNRHRYQTNREAVAAPQSTLTSTPKPSAPTTTQSRIEDAQTLDTLSVKKEEIKKSKALTEHITLPDEKPVKTVSWASVAKGQIPSEMYGPVHLDPVKSCGPVNVESEPKSHLTSSVSSSTKRKIGNAPLSTPLNLFSHDQSYEATERNRVDTQSIMNQGMLSNEVNQFSAYDEGNIDCQQHGLRTSSFHPASATVVEISALDSSHVAPNTLSQVACGISTNPPSHGYDSYQPSTQQDHHYTPNGNARLTEPSSRHREGVRLQNAPMPIIVSQAVDMEKMGDTLVSNEFLETQTPAVPEEITMTPDIVFPNEADTPKSLFQNNMPLSNKVFSSEAIDGLSISPFLLPEQENGIIHETNVSTIETENVVEHSDEGSVLPNDSSTESGGECNQSALTESYDVASLTIKTITDKAAADDVSYPTGMHSSREDHVLGVELSEGPLDTPIPVDQMVMSQIDVMPVDHSSPTAMPFVEQAAGEKESTTFTHETKPHQLENGVKSDLVIDSIRPLDEQSEVERSVDNSLHDMYSVKFQNRIFGKREMTHDFNTSCVKKRSTGLDTDVQQSSFSLLIDFEKPKTDSISTVPYSDLPQDQFNPVELDRSKDVVGLKKTDVDVQDHPETQVSNDLTPRVLVAPESRVYSNAFMITVREIMKKASEQGKEAKDTTLKSENPTEGLALGVDSADGDRKTTGKISINFKADSEGMRDTIPKHFSMMHHDNRQGKPGSNGSVTKESTWRGGSGLNNGSSGGSPLSLSMQTSNLLSGSTRQPSGLSRSNFMGNRHTSMEATHRRNSPEKDSESAWRISAFPRKPVESSRVTLANNITDHGEKIDRTLRVLLNKLTLEKFDTLYKQLKTCGMVDAEDVKRLMRLICLKAKTQHHYIPMYVRLCLLLHRDIPAMNIKMNGEGEFRRLLVDACQASFEETLKPIVAPEEMNEEDAFEYILFEKKKMKGNMIFVGELAKVKMIAGKVLYNCINCLLSNKGEPQLEALCVLLHTAGFYMHTGKFKDDFERQMKLVYELARDPKVSKRLRCLLQDVLDDHKNGWEKSKREPDGPKKLDVLRKELQTEARQKFNTCGKQDYMNSGLQGVKYNRYNSDDEFQTVGQYGMNGGRRNNNGRNNRQMGNSSHDMRGSTSGSFGQYNVNSARGDTSMGASSSGPNRYGGDSSKSMLMGGSMSFNLSRGSMSKQSPHHSKGQSQKDHGRGLLTFLDTDKGGVQQGFFNPLETISNDTSKSFVSNLRQLSSIKVPESLTSDLSMSPSRMMEESLQAIDREEAKEKIEIFASRCSIDDSASVEESLSSLKTYLKSHDTTIDDLAYLVGTALLLVIESRASRQLMLRDWLLEWPSRKLISQDAFHLGLTDFLKYRYESAKCDNPNLRSVFETSILKKAHEIQLIPTSLFEELTEEIADLEKS